MGISGTSGDDILLGTSGDDVIAGNAGNDFIRGFQGNDFLLGGRGNDFLNGNLGNDEVFGGQGDDTVMGGQNDDFLYGNAGSDTLVGGTGNDTFVFTFSSTGFTDGIDTITDFSVGEDKLLLDLGSDAFLSLEGLSFVQVGSNVNVSYEGDQFAILADHLYTGNVSDYVDGFVIPI